MMKRKALWSFILAFLLALPIIGTALAAPILPHSSYGTVKVNGANVADGTEVTAWVNGTQYGTATTQTWNGDSVYVIEVFGDDPDTPAVEGAVAGDTITFQIDGQDADQTATWASGSSAELDLTAGGGTPTPTPTPTGPTPTPAPSDGNVIIPLVSAGDLAVDWASVIFPQTSLAGQDVLAYAIDETWSISDTTNLGAGWHVTIIADDHLRGSGDPTNRVINVGASEDFKVSCLDGEISTVSGDNTNLPGCPTGSQAVPIAGESPLTMLTADASDGMGVYDFVPHFQLLVPGTTIIDTYTTNIFVDAIAGP